MESDQSPSTPSTPPSDSFYSLQSASIDNLALQSTRPDERLLDPSAPSQGTSMSPEIFQRNFLPNIGTFSTSIDVHSYSSNVPNIPHTNLHYHSPRLDTSLPPQLIQSQPLGVLHHPYPANNVSRHDLPQSTSLARNNLDPHPQSQELIKWALLGSFLRPSTSSGPPPDAATASIHRESLDESGPQATSLLPK